MFKGELWCNPTQHHAYAMYEIVERWTEVVDGSKIGLIGLGEMEPLNEIKLKWRKLTEGHESLMQDEFREGGALASGALAMVVVLAKDSSVQIVWMICSYFLSYCCSNERIQLLAYAQPHANAPN